MKKIFNTAFVYVICGALGGVFFREFTKFNDFTGKTALSYIHPHLIGLGALVFLILALFANQNDFTADKNYKHFYIVYNTGLIGTNLLFLIRGIFQVLNTNLSNGFNSAISGIAGLFHIVLFAGIVRLVLLLKKQFQ